MKQKESSTVRPCSPRTPLGVTEKGQRKDSSPDKSVSEQVLQKLNTIENLLKKKDDKPLTFKEACSYLGYAPSYLYKLTYQKIIPHYKPTGKIIFFSKNEIDEWIYSSSECRTKNVELKAEGNTVEHEEKDPNQVDMFEKQQDQNEVVIEFPLKSRRKR